MAYFSNGTEGRFLTNTWIKCSDQMPAEGKIVMTKLHDFVSCRNEQKLIYKDGLWWFSDMSMYVYYTPTHWKFI